ncbi:hypothetical protein IAT38_003857 [Cryptococcus sp. DSM 104549]
MSCTAEPCNYDVGSANLLSGEVLWMYYKYQPSLSAAKAFLPLFAIMAISSIFMSFKRRNWWALYTICIGAVLEAIGWGGRYVSAKKYSWDPSNGGEWDTKKPGFIVQIICLIVAPTFFSAANYVILGSLVKRAGQVTGLKFSSITPRSFSIVFTFTDFICLIIQLLGGGIVGKSSTNAQLKTGLHVMAVGVILQLAITLIFIILLGEFTWRWTKSRQVKRQIDLLCGCCSGRNKNKQAAGGPVPMTAVNTITKDSSQAENGGVAELAGNGEDYQGDKLMKLVVWTLLAATILIVVRSIYRCDELLGFSPGHLGAYGDESLFLGMDAALMLVLLVVYSLFHPGWIFGKIFGLKKSKL